MVSKGVSSGLRGFQYAGNKLISELSLIKGYTTIKKPMVFNALRHYILDQ